MKLAVIFSLVLICGCSKNYDISKTNPEKPGIQPGRYQLVQLGQMRRDQYLLDTATGRLWTVVCGAGAHGVDCEYAYWSEADVLGLNVTLEQATAHEEAIKNALNARKKK